MPVAGFTVALAAAFVMGTPGGPMSKPPAYSTATARELEAGFRAEFGETVVIVSK
jgi:hypothetical protein